MSSTAPVRCFHLTAPVLSGEKHLTSANIINTAPVRCFHLTAPVLSGEKHLTSAKIINTAPVRCFHLTAPVLKNTWQAQKSSTLRLSGVFSWQP